MWSNLYTSVLTYYISVNLENGRKNILYHLNNSLERKANVERRKRQNKDMIKITTSASVHSVLQEKSSMMNTAWKTIANKLHIVHNYLSNITAAKSAAKSFSWRRCSNVKVIRGYSS